MAADRVDFRRQGAASPSGRPTLSGSPCRAAPLSRHGTPSRKLRVRSPDPGEGCDSPGRDGESATDFRKSWDCHECTRHLWGGRSREYGLADARVRVVSTFSDEDGRVSAMTHTWILDVLTDLGIYARDHDLTALAEQLDDARHVASTEIASRAEDRDPDGTERRRTATRHEGEARGAL